MHGSYSIDFLPLLLEKNKMEFKVQCTCLVICNLLFKNYLSYKHLFISNNSQII